MKNDYFKKMSDAFKALPIYVIQIGIIEGKSPKRDDQTKSQKNAGQKFVTNAEILFIAENGSKARHIPKRPVLSITLNWAMKKGLIDRTYKKAIAAFIDSGFQESAIDNEVEKCCIQIEEYAREMILNNDPRLARNAAYTVAKKGFDHPLFQTGNLAKAIRCQYIKIRKG